MKKTKKTNRIISLGLAAALLAACLLGGCAKDGNTGENGGGNVGSRSVTSVEFDPHPFGMDDLTVNGNVRLGMKPDEVREIMGQPDSEQTLTDDFIYGQHVRMTYGGLSLTFYDVDGGEDYTLGIISASSDEPMFSCGLRVGCTADEVIAAFTRSEEVEPLYFPYIEESCGDYLYGTYTMEDFLLEKPEGVVQYAYINRYGMEDSHEYLLEYYFVNPLIWQGEYSGYSGDYYSMVFYVDADTDLVTAINLNYDVFL